MKAAGSLCLKLAGVLEILAGAATIASMSWLLSQSPEKISMFGIDYSEATLWVAVVTFAIAIIQVIAGFIGVIFSSKLEKGKVCMAFGILLILMHVFSFGHFDFKIGDILSNIYALIVPVLYYYGATLNKQQLAEERIH